MALLASLLVSLATQVATPQIWVDSRRGNDGGGGGDGTADRPFKTIARAFAMRSMSAEPWVEVRLQVGYFSVGMGEAVPIVVPAGVRLVGYGTGSTELLGIDGLPVLVLPNEGRVAIESLALRGGSAGVVVRPGGNGRLDAELTDLLIEETLVAIDLTAAAGSVALRVEGVRTRAKQQGLHADAGSALELTIERSTFAGGQEGVVLDDGRVDPAGAPRRVALRDCRFEGSEGAGFVRRGVVAREVDGPAWEFDRCEFRGARFGLALELPSGDVPFLVRDCVFRENLNFGATIVGSGTTLPGESRMERCHFRWNGVGAQLLATGRTLALSDCRFEDSIGMGLNVGNFTGEHSRFALSRCLFACNGAAGFFAICERPDGLEATLEQCTAVDNRGNGFERKNRKFGTAQVRLLRSIASGHGSDVVRFEPAELIDCFVGGDPRFIDRAQRDWRLAPDSPAQDPQGAFGALPIFKAAGR
ncbi:MAG: DUF1565 domain-containing protein [Planctomycetes bacterium]|nr:DUF1565 domain-containing protein [Planctomycetota bacterium]